MKRPEPLYEKSELIMNAQINRTLRTETGDMWPMTWAEDDRLYFGAGDNTGPAHINQWSPMNVWRANGTGDQPEIELVHNLPVDPVQYCAGVGVDRVNGVKPAGLIDIDGILYMSVENINYGDNPSFNRQHNINGWIIRSKDYGVTWDVDATPQDFFRGRVSSCHVLQAGKGRNCVMDGYVWAYFPCGLDSDDSWWCCGDGMLLGRVSPERLLDRNAWVFYTGTDANNIPLFSENASDAVSVFTYPGFTGENHVSYNPYIKRYILANYAFYDPETGLPHPYHNEPIRNYVSQLTIYESESPWGEWKLFYREDEWLTGGYQPSFPVKWMAEDGLSMVMVGSGNFDDYCFITQNVEYELHGM